MATPARRPVTADIRELTEGSEFKQLEQIFAEIWSRDGPPPISAELMRAMAHSGNYVVGARVSGQLAAGLVGFLGKTRDHALHLHSHILGVLPRYQLHGAGFALKQHQRTWALDRGITVVTWTFDPLVRRNGYFNLSKLGAEVCAYHDDFYGAMGDRINGKGASDRAEAVWRLDSERSVRSAVRASSETEVEALVAHGAEIALLEAPDGAPRTQPATGPLVLCQVPADIVALRRQNPGLADEWRQALRVTFGHALMDGYAATGMTHSGWYVVRRQA